MKVDVIKEEKDGKVFKLTIDSDNKKDYHELIMQICTDCQIDAEEGFKNAKIGRNLTHYSIMKFCMNYGFVCVVNGQNNETTVIFDVKDDQDTAGINKSSDEDLGF